VNTQLFEAVQRIGKENCYIVTKGDEKYQLDKIARSGFASLFHPSHVFVTTNSKREHIERIQAENAGEEMVFLDDKEHTFDELKGLPNLTTIHYKENILEVMKQIENKNPIPEFKKPR
jgi:aminoglycoside N3'-acetyltransferase